MKYVLWDLLNVSHLCTPNSVQSTCTNLSHRAGIKIGGEAFFVTTPPPPHIYIYTHIFVFERGSCSDFKLRCWMCWYAMKKTAGMLDLHPSTPRPPHPQTLVIMYVKYDAY